MGIERRWWRDRGVNRREEVLYMHLYPDGSPVTGAELQGMVLQVVFKNSSARTIILPGVYLHYGGCRAIDTVVCFLDFASGGRRRV